MKKIFLSAAILSFLTISCSSDSTADVEESSNNITYTNGISQIITPSCATSACHDNNAPAAGLSLTDFTKVKSAFQNTDALTRIESGNMPKGGSKLSATSIANLKSWIAASFP